MARDALTVSRTMKAVKSADTTPELVLRRGVSASGFRYRLHYDKLPGKPDMVFVSARVAVFVDGDYYFSADVGYLFLGG